MMAGVWLLMDAAEDAKGEEAEGSMKKRDREQREEAVGFDSREVVARKIRP